MAQVSRRFASINIDSKLQLRSTEKPIGAVDPADSRLPIYFV